MAEKFKNRYRIKSSRAEWWDYSWAGAYFITICTKNRRHYFGRIVNGKMVLSRLGVLADIFWYEIKNHAPNAELGKFVVMPNHIHGILILKNPPNGQNGNDINDNNGLDKRGAAETGHALSLRTNAHTIQPPPLTHGQKRFQNQGKNTVSSIIGGYKAAVTKHANRLGFEFGWQTRFDDRIIWNIDSYHRIHNYIKNNPKNWKGDCFFD